MVVQSLWTGSLGLYPTRVFYLKYAALHAISADLFDKYGRSRPSTRHAHVQAVMESILRAMHVGNSSPTEVIENYESSVKTMHTVLGRPLSSSDWRAAYLYAIVEP